MGSKASEFQELVRGASINQLAQLFDLDRRTVADRLKDVSPTGKRNTFPIYKIADVAELLVVGYMTQEKLTEAQKLKRAGPEKDYWDAQLKRLKFLETTGDLWRTDKVIETLAEVFKLFRESVVVFADEMEHESGLSNAQIEKVKQFCDSLLVELRGKLVTMDLPDLPDHEGADLLEPHGDNPSVDDDRKFLDEMGLT